jgi:hypothetical protein
MIWSAKNASEATRKKHITMRERFSFTPLYRQDSARRGWTTTLR